jgi:polyphosphate kinase
LATFTKVAVGSASGENGQVELLDPRLYLNRELSWLAFNERVLEEAADRSLPLFERLRFLGIVATNLDEFFMVRVAGLKQQLAGGVAETGPDAMLPADQLTAISERAHAVHASLYRLWREDLVPALTSNGLHLLARDHLTADQRQAARNHFLTSVFPALTPLAVDPGHPFPHLRNKSLNLAVLLTKNETTRKPAPKTRTTKKPKPVAAKPESSLSIAVVQVPAVLSRAVPLPCASGQAFLLLGELIGLFSAELFPGFSVSHVATFRVTRNWDLSLDEEESEDLLSTVQEELRRRDRGQAVRLELDDAASPELEASLTRALGLSASDVYRAHGPLQIQDLVALAEADPRPELRVEPFVAAVPAPLRRDSDSVVTAISQRDLLLHHPYESFDPVVRFIEEAADDPNVLAIKQTLYRTSGDSPLVRALSRAAENGKQVAVLVEIKARFDEANNIAWARRLEETGVHVVYGLIGLKTHCKVSLVVRREPGGIRRYVHIGTGNYNPQTARNYTDWSLFSARLELGEDVTALFNMLTGYADAPPWKRLSVAPLGLHERILALIDRETDRAKKGEPARIVAKMNALSDPAAIRALYAASQAGVEIDLLIRGICCLRPGVPGVSERIRVTSLIDRFLEHERVFVFGAAERAEVFLSSGDWMARNFVRRVEVMCPVEDPILRTRILEEVVSIGLRDNTKARRLTADGHYVPIPVSGEPVRSQLLLLDLAKRIAQPAQVIRHGTVPGNTGRITIPPV